MDISRARPAARNRSSVADVDGTERNKQTRHAKKNEERSFQLDAVGRKARGIVQDLKARIVEKVFLESFGSRFVKGEFLCPQRVPERREASLGLLHRHPPA